MTDHVLAAELFRNLACALDPITLPLAQASQPPGKARFDHPFSLVSLVEPVALFHSRSEAACGGARPVSCEMSHRFLPEPPTTSGGSGQSWLFRHFLSRAGCKEDHGVLAETA